MNRLKKKDYPLTIEGALTAADEGKIEKWVLQFLDADPYQKSLGPAFRSQKNLWVGPIEYPLENLKRITGVDPQMLYPTTPEKFEQRVCQVLKGMENGWHPLPLIISDFWDDIHISDGNHRHEALQRLGYKKYWVIFQSRTNEGIEKFLNTLK